MSPVGLGERKLFSGTPPSNITTALPAASSLVTTRRTSAGFCGCACWARSGEGSAKHAPSVHKAKIRFLVCFLPRTIARTAALQAEPEPVRSCRRDASIQEVQRLSRLYAGPSLRRRPIAKDQEEV